MRGSGHGLRGNDPDRLSAHRGPEYQQGMHGHHAGDILFITRPSHGGNHGTAHRLAGFPGVSPNAYLRRGEPLTCHPAEGTVCSHQLPSWSSTRSRSPAVRSHPGPAGTSRRSRLSHLASPARVSPPHPIAAVQGITDYGTIGYTGPCPPPGSMIRYQFRVYGLDTMLDLPAGFGQARPDSRL